MTHTRTAAVILAAALILGAGAYANLGKVDIGTAMPNFKLTDYTGTTHDLADYAGKVVVISFMSKDCPWSRGAAPSISALSKTYDTKDVVFIGIDSSAGMRPADAEAYAKSASIAYPIALDTGNVYADRVGATRTPELFIVDRDGKLAYHGAFDDRKVPEEAGSVDYAKQAIDSLLAGKAVANPKVNAWGCSIKRAPKKLS